MKEDSSIKKGVKWFLNIIVGIVLLGVLRYIVGIF